MIIRKNSLQSVGANRATNAVVESYAQNPEIQTPQDKITLLPTLENRQKKTSKPKSLAAEKTQIASPPASPRVTGFQNGPQAVLEAPEIGQVDGPSGGQTLAEAVAQARKPSAADTARLDSLPQPGLTPGRKAGLLRRIGQGFLSFLTSDNLSPFQKDLKAINKLESMAKGLKTPEQFQDKTADLKARLANGESLADIRNEAYAVAREACVQSLGMRPYDCQILGALAMDDGHIAEMRTGEGKTLTAVLPLYLNALAGQGAQLVTVNDTLAARDAEDMAPAFELLGLSVGTVLEDMKKDEKRAGYAADVTYTTDRALGFDYLRDRSATNPVQKMQREPFFALIDEVDEVLIDEARSPLIISGGGKPHQSEYTEFNEIVASLKPDADYYFDRKKHSVWLSETGYARVENKLQQRALQAELAQSPSPVRSKEIQKELGLRDKLSNLITEEQREFDEHRDVKRSKPGWWARRIKGAEWDESTLETARSEYDQAIADKEELLDQLPSYNLFSDENAYKNKFLTAALKAHALFKVDEDYTVSDGKVEIVDQNKGRTSEGRRYNDGVHQALEAKHGVAIQNDTRTTATITYPNLFKRYPRLSGMSGTAKTSEYEFVELYDLDVVQVPTNKPVIREDKPDLVFQTLNEKFEALANDAYRDFAEGRPVLIGTLSVEHNEWLAKLLLDKGVPRESLQILNAETVRGDKEGENEMISQAGRSGVITVATNLAGRGANIKPDLVNFQKLSQATVTALNEGHSVSITMNKKKEADWLASWLQGIPTSVVPASEKSGPSESSVQIRFTEDVDHQIAPSELSQTLHLNADDFPTNGLKVYGTTRSFSRRIDDQLIGRSGRQGAPGTSQFYLSLEDDLFRVFGSKHLDTLLGLFLEPGQGIESGIVDTVIAKVQGSVEEEHYKSRESSNKQDEVLNLHRETFFTMRDELLKGGSSMVDRFEAMVGNAMMDSINATLPEKKSKLSYGQYREAVEAASADLGVDIPLAFLEDKTRNPDSKKMKREDFEYEVRDLANRQIQKIMRALDSMPGPSDATLRPMLLEPVDGVWTDHLDQMDLLHTAVQWRSIAQMDPEVEFKLDAFDLFGESVGLMEKAVTKGPYQQMLGLSELLTSVATQTANK